MKKIVYRIPKKVILIFILAILVLIFGYIAYMRYAAVSAEKKRVEAFNNVHATVIERIARLSVLEYRYTEVMELKRKAIVGGTSNSLVRFSGVITAGIADIGGVDARFDAVTNTVYLRVPDSEILTNTVDVSTLKMWDLKRNLFVPISIELKIQEVAVFKDAVAAELVASGFLTEASERTREVVSALYAALGASVVIEGGSR